MRFFPARSVAWATLVPALVLFVLVPGCAKQDEGERCGEELGAASDDCDDGLTCTLKTTLINNGGDANRCCYRDRVSDSRCEPKGIDTPADAGDAGDSDAGDSADAGDGG